MAWACDVNWELITAAIATAVSVYALFQTHRHKVMEVRPWFKITKMEHRTEGTGQRLVLELRHVSGGAALNVRCSISIAGATSSETTAGPALVPGDTVGLVSHVITGPPITDRQEVKWTFTFEDEFQNAYEIVEVTNLRGQQISYSSRKR